MTRLTRKENKVKIRNQSGIAPIAIILIVIVILVGGGVWYYQDKTDVEDGCIAMAVTLRNKNTGECKSYPTPCDVPDDLSPEWIGDQRCVNEEEETATQEIDTSNWKTYRNEEYGYEVRYPKDWELGSFVAVFSQAAIRFNKITEQDGRYINEAIIDVIVEPNPLREIPTEKWYREWIKQIPAGINLDRVKIKETVFSNLEALKIDDNAIFFSRGTDMFRIDWKAVGNYDEQLIIFTEQIFQYFLSTFRFLE